MTCEFGVLHHIPKLASTMAVIKTMIETGIIIFQYYKFSEVLCTLSHHMFLSASQVLYQLYIYCCSSRNEKPDFVWQEKAPILGNN